jgi:hypothetical protein
VRVDCIVWHGAFGYGGKRTVKVRPLLGYCNIVTNIDLSEVNKEEWIYVNEEGDIKVP